MTTDLQFFFPAMCRVQLRKAYRRLALKHHPDKNPGDAASTERFQAVKAAYDVRLSFF